MKMSPLLVVLTLAISGFVLVAQAVDFGRWMPPEQSVILAAGSADEKEVQGRKTRRPPSPLMLALDVNRDGTIDVGEIAHAPTELTELDRNRDGKLTRDELESPKALRRESPGAGKEPLASAEPPSPLMQALDANHDGTIDAEEIANAPAELATLDKNGDGRLTGRELQPAPAPPYGGPESDNDLTPNEVSNVATTAIRL